MEDGFETSVKDKMAVIITIACVLFISFGVQASDYWNYGLMKVKENKTYIYYYCFDNSENQSGAYDTYNQLIAFSNGQNGDLFIFNYETSIAIYFSDGVRYENSKHFFDYLKKNTLKELYYERRAEGYLCRPTTTPPGFSANLTAILKHLIDGFSCECQAFSTAIWAATITSDTLSSSLSGYDSLIGEISVQSSIDVESLVGLYQGLGDFFGLVDGGIQFFVKKRINLDVAKIIQAASYSGFHVLVTLIEGLSSYLKRLDELSDYLNNQYSFFQLIRKLGGNKNGGGDKNQLHSFIYTIVDVLSVIKQELSLNNLRTTLRLYYETGSRDVDIEKQWRGAVKNLLGSIKKLKLERELKNLAKLLQDILDEKWKFKGVDMSWICKSLFALKKANDTSFESKLKYFLENLDKKIH